MDIESFENIIEGFPVVIVVMMIAYAVAHLVMKIHKISDASKELAHKETIDAYKMMFEYMRSRGRRGDD